MKRAWRAAAWMLGIGALATTPLAAQSSGPLSITPSPSARPSTARPAISPATPTPGASTAVVAPSIEQVNAYLNSLVQLTGSFSQTGPDGKHTNGRLYVHRPGRLRFEYEPPSQLEIIADGKSVALRDRRLATQDLYSLSQTPLKFLVADRIDLRRDTTVKRAELKGDSYLVVLTDRSTFGGTSEIALIFDAKVTALRYWVVTDPQGYTTTVNLSNLDTSKRLDDKLFVIDYQRIL
ncbi:Outer membrane lipoprotein-sorting protein [Rhizobiales bacterium GAS191]|nr:Outer membrane lipoprotein-sorting protein [Rhizobiales bacterium GAS191]